MENYRNQPDSEENAWPTVLTALPTSGANMNSEEEQEYENENKNENENENEELAPATLPVATARSMTSNNGRTPQLQAAAHSRGLTSTLSGRRQRQELLSHDIHQQHRSPSAASTVPDMLDSQTPIDAPPAFATRRNSSRAAQDSPRQNQQQLVPKGQSAWSDSSRRNSGYKNTSIGAGADTVFGNANEDDDDEDAPPPESLLVEVSPQKHSEPPAAPVRRYTSSRDQGLQLHQAINWADAQPQRPAPEPSSSGGGGTTGFVRRAAHAVHSRIQDISSHAADAPRLGAPMPPPRRRSREPYGDGRAFSVADSASIAWPRRDARQQRSRASSAPLSYRERALRSWRDSKYQDEFFCRVYAYYAGKGALTIVLSRVLQLVTLAFVVVLSTFVLGCIDHAKVRKQRSLSEVVVPQCTRHFSWTVTLALSSFLLFWLAQMVRTLMELPLLLEIRAFYTEVLGIQPADIGTLAWHEVVSRMVKLRDVEIREYRGLTKSRVLGHRLTADGIVNRIMRRENYMIALFNKGLLNITIPGLGKEQVLTKALEWNLSFCLMSYLFDERGQVRHRFLKESNRDILSKGLRRRFQFMAAINMIFAPFIVVFLVLYGFLRYFDQLYHEPGTLTSRAFTPYAKYKFRNFNEVPHSFRRRLTSAHPKATLYLGQFRNDALITVVRFVSFVAGSFTALLLVLTVLDNELSLEFEITPHRTVLFYIGMFSAILAAARGMIPADEQEYLHPAWIIRDALEDLQYMEPDWRGKLDTTQVRREFEALFGYKLLIFAHELLGVITAPFVMLVSLPGCAESVVDFFREFTVHESGLGYVCSFAVFDFERHGNVKFAAPTRAAGEHLASKHGKMEQSFLAFKADYPEWQPRDQAASIYLQRAQNAQQDLWRMGSVVSGAGAGVGTGAGWQGRLLQQQRMAGSIFPTGASLYRPNQNSNNTNINQNATAGATAAVPRPPPLPDSALNNARSQFVFQPPGFNSPATAQLYPQQSLASQAMLPFGPTLGGLNIAVNRGKGKGRDRDMPPTEHGDAPPTDRLALSSLPLVASTEMGNSMDMSMNAGRMAPQTGVFSIVNQLYEQHLP